jgi:hypothetical protein
MYILISMFIITQVAEHVLDCVSELQICKDAEKHGLSREQAEVVLYDLTKSVYYMERNNRFEEYKSKGIDIIPLLIGVIESDEFTASQPNLDTCAITKDIAFRFLAKTKDKRAVEYITGNLFKHLSDEYFELSSMDYITSAISALGLTGCYQSLKHLCDMQKNGFFNDKKYTKIVEANNKHPKKRIIYKMQEKAFIALIHSGTIYAVDVLGKEKQINNMFKSDMQGFFAEAVSFYLKTSKYTSKEYARIKKQLYKKYNKSYTEKKVKPENRPTTPHYILEAGNTVPIPD